MQKNVAGQKWVVFAFQDEGGANPGEPVTGDAANITANLRIDGGAANAVDDTNPTELEDGYYVFDITQAETNGNMILLAPQSSTANVNVIAVPGVVFTTPPNFPTLGIESDGDLTKVNTLDGHTAQTGDAFARLGAPAGASAAADIAAIKAVVDAILADTGTDGVVLSTAQVNTIRDAISAKVVESEGSITLQQALSIILAYAAGEATGQDTTGPAFLTPNGNATRISAVTDGSGNRSSVTTTPSS